MALAAEEGGYLPDTCTLMHWGSVIVGADPKDAAFREWIWSSLETGLLQIPAVIAEELQDNSPSLREVLAKQKVEIMKLDHAIESQAKDLLANLKAQGRILGKRCVDVEDLELILTAKRYGMTVITQEAQGRGRCNIPTVCQELGVPYMNSAQLRAKLGL
ncbi:MAG: DUF4411 family protein [Ectothiorhodospiraceae bacterium AqS1]|nr:DUF4411 family protein [Ectothiorhodospiraceae bacterium AqS1]